MPRRNLKVPLWVTIVIIVATLPAALFPTLLGMCPPAAPELRTLLWCYPFYALLTAALAWLSWPERPYMTWILVVLLILTHAAVWAAVSMPF